MNWLIKRRYFKDDYTLGQLFIDGVVFSDTLEDKYRALPEEKKVYGQTAIPPGEYRVIMSYSPKFGRVLPELLNVPYFENIRIHSLNFASESEGCIGVGKNTIVGGITSSRYYSDVFNTICTEYLKTNTGIWLKIC